MLSSPITSWQIVGEKVEAVIDFIFLDSKTTADGDCSSKASILRCSAFFIVQLSHPYVTNGKTIALTRQTFVDKVMSPLLNMLSRLVIIFLPRSKRLLISWLQSPSVVILEHKERKFFTISAFSPSICREVMGLDAVILILVLSLLFHSLPSSSSRGSLVPLHFLPLEWYHLYI